MIKTFHKVWLLVFLLFSVVYCYGYENVHDIDREDDFRISTGDWNIHQNYSYSSLYGISFDEIQSLGYYELISLNIHPQHYAVENDRINYEDTEVELKFGYKNNLRHSVKFTVEVGFFEHENFHFYEIEEDADFFYEQSSDHQFTINLSSKYYNLECIKSIKVFANVKKINPDYDFLVWVMTAGLYNMVQLNPEIENYVLNYIRVNPGTVKSGDMLSFYFNIYYGLPSQDIDLYFAFYNGIDLYVNMTTILSFPQYTMTKKNEFIMDAPVNDYPFNPGENLFAIGITEKDSVEFLHPLITDSVYYE